MIATTAGTAVESVTATITLPRQNINLRYLVKKQKGEPGGSPFC
jgi:hypothetical protein